MNWVGYYRGYKDPHLVLKMYSKIARTLPELSVLRVPMHVPDSIANKFNNKIIQLFFKLFSHFFILMRIKKIKSNKIIVREFLTVPLLFVSPIMWFWRKRLLFLCQHNLAFAKNNISHKLALQLLHAVGFQFIVFDDISLWSFIDKKIVSSPYSRVREVKYTKILRAPWSMEKIQKINRKTNIYSIPQPIYDQNLDFEISKSKASTVGFVGNFRKEKSPEWAIKQLINLQKDIQKEQRFKILIGSPDKTFLSSFKSDEIITVNTSSYKDYLLALSQCDLLVLPYDKKAYAYRTSGVLSEAISLNTKVVIPCIPGLKEQLFYPEKAGECYPSQSDLSRIITEMLSKLKSTDFDMAIKVHKEYRGEKNITKLLLEIAND